MVELLSLSVLQITCTSTREKRNYGAFVPNAALTSFWHNDREEGAGRTGTTAQNGTVKDKEKMYKEQVREVNNPKRSKVIMIFVKCATVLKWFKEDALQVFVIMLKQAENEILALKSENKICDSLHVISPYDALHPSVSFAAQLFH